CGSKNIDFAHKLSLSERKVGQNLHISLDSCCYGLHKPNMNIGSKQEILCWGHVAARQLQKTLCLF
ncbi:MAG TPA: hypothetical protein PKA12_15965, partial [Saprospiraceae bacterium]|nr:hypothetical protein [Saprospiraceae bacterium]